jgi:hypothetical protein
MIDRSLSWGRFSCRYFAHERKARQRNSSRAHGVTIETDAPDQFRPSESFTQCNDDGKPINHPGNLRAVCEFAAELLRQLTKPSLLEENFTRLFGGVL